MKLLEIVPTPDTAPETLATGFALAAKLGKIPVQAGICDGFIGNRILKRYRAAAEDLVRRGVAIADVDAAMRGFGFAMGPFEAQDLGGLDIAYLQREAARARGETVPETLGDILVRAGRKGQKTGGGWYDYAPGDRKPRPSARRPTRSSPRQIAPGATRRPTSPSTSSPRWPPRARRSSPRASPRSPSDIDLVEVHGYGFPRRRGGPMFHSALSSPSTPAADADAPPTRA